MYSKIILKKRKLERNSLKYKVYHDIKSIWYNLLHDYFLNENLLILTNSDEIIYTQSNLMVETMVLK